MIEISILELLYLALTFFIVIIGTLLTMILLKVMKILKVAEELSGYYFQVKNTLAYYAKVPQHFKDKAVSFFSGKGNNDFKTGFDFARKDSSKKDS